MKDDNTLREETSDDTNALNGTNKEVPGSAGEVPVTPPKKRSSGRGLYITAIVLGVIVVLLLALYIFLSLTYKPHAHSFIAPSSSIAQISKGWTFTDRSAILYPDIKYILVE